MARPKNSRIIKEPPLLTEFKPTGIARKELEQINLSIDEFEAARLADHIGLSHEEAAEEMEISRSTFTRLIEQSRKKIVEFIIQGKVLTINGGSVHFRNNIFKCSSCEHMFKTDINDNFVKCPECNSSDLFNLAGGFGHGKCCETINQ